jgi:regulator of sigma E protease
VRVTEFFLGMPSRIKISHRSKRYGTEFGVTPILIGGYNRICGMEGQGSPRAAEVLDCVQRRGVVSVGEVADELGMDDKTAYGDLELLFDWGSVQALEPLALLGDEALADALYATLARDGADRCAYDREHDFSLEGTTADGEPHPVEDVEAFFEEERAHTYEGKGLIARLLIILAGPFVNILLSFVVVTGIMYASSYEAIVDTNVLGGVDEGGLAWQAGIRAGDALVDVDGTPCETWGDVYDALDAALATQEPFEVTYERDGQRTTTQIAIPEGGADMIGVMATVEEVRPTLGEAALSALNYGRMVAQTISRLFVPRHTVEVLSQSSSVVGISVMASEAVHNGIEDVFALIAAVSMSLGFMNLLPLLPLDGGRIVLELIQAIIRRPVPNKVQAYASYAGLLIFLAIFVFALHNDILRIFAL